MNEKEKSRIKYEKPEAQRLVETKAHGECSSPGSGDSNNCAEGNIAGGFCASGMSGSQPE
jgi:hypothetical protein